MLWLTFVPVALALAFGMVLGVVPLPLHPAWAARLLAIVAAGAGVATIGTLVFITLNYGATLFSNAAERLPEWALFGDDRPVPAALGIPAIVLSLLITLVACRLASRWTVEVGQARRDSRTVLESDVPLALAVPGRDGGVLVSRGLLRLLDQAQLRVVFEHEASHLRHRHHRYLALGALVAGTLPLLRRLNTRLRFALERWADEDTAEAVGDRTLVAHTIAHVALARSSNDATVRTDPAAPPFPAFTESGVVQRVEALLGTPPAKNPVGGPVILAGVGMSSGLLASVAWHLDHAIGMTFL